MDAIKLLKDQHREVEKLFKRFEALDEGSDEEKVELFEEIADRLAAHATIEERIFYPAVKVKSTEELLGESVEEHLAVKRLLADLLELPASDEQFIAKMTVVKEQVEHHVEEEEQELFPQVRKLFTRDELEMMGAQMEEMFMELSEQEPRRMVAAETDAAPSLQ